MREAAALAGVSLSTMRRWADDERIRSFRTAGGHRRFHVADVRQALLDAAPPPRGMGSALLGELTTTEIRQQLAPPHQTPAWLEGIDDPARERLALLGRRLVQLIEDYVGRQRSRAALLGEAQAFGRVYGRELVAARMTLRQSLEAFTFFRRGLEDAARRIAAGCRPTVTADDLRDHLDVLNDRLLVGLAEAYDEPPARLPVTTAATDHPPRE